MGEEADLRYLSELLARLKDDVRLIESDMSEISASAARVRSGVASPKGDVARLEGRPDSFHEATIDRFDGLMKSFSRHLMAEQFSRSEDENADDRNSRWREDRHVLE
jgi:hypothetical protein